MGPKYFLLESGLTLKMLLKPTGCNRNDGRAHILSEVKSLNIKAMEFLPCLLRCLLLELGAYVEEGQLP